MFGHEVDGFGRYVFGRHHQITFVLAIFFVNENDDAASSHLADDVLNRADTHGMALLLEGPAILRRIHQAFDVTRDQVHFQINSAAALQVLERRDSDGVWNQVDGEVGAVNAIGGQAHAIYRD